MVGDLTGKGIVDVIAGASFSLAVTDSGDVFSWGWGEFGQLGLGQTTSARRPTLITALAGVPIVKVSSSGSHVVAITSAGVTYAWGSGSEGQLGIGDGAMVVSVPRPVPFFDKSSVKLVASGGGMHYGVSIVITEETKGVHAAAAYVPPLVLSAVNSRGRGGASASAGDHTVQSGHSKGHRKHGEDGDDRGRKRSSRVTFSSAASTPIASRQGTQGDPTASSPVSASSNEMTELLVNRVAELLDVVTGQIKSIREQLALVGERQEAVLATRRATSRALYAKKAAVSLAEAEIADAVAREDFTTAARISEEQLEPAELELKELGQKIVSINQEFCDLDLAREALLMQEEETREE